MPRMQFSGPALVTLGALAATTAITLGALPPLVGALTGAEPSSSDPATAFVAMEESHLEELEADRRRFDGRSLFFAPVRLEWMGMKPPPPRPPAPVVKPVEEKPEIDPEPVAPRQPERVVYNGPGVKGVDGRFVYFDTSDDVRIAVGETGTVRSGTDVTVVSVGEIPWTVRIEYRGETFDLSIVDDDERTDMTKIFAAEGGLEGLEVSGRGISSSSRSQLSSPSRRATPSGRNRATPSGRRSSRDD